MNAPDPSPAQQRKSSAILDAARSHFARHGFEATKLSAVARDAGVAVGTIYLRYAGKAELLRGVLDSLELTFCDAIDTPQIWETPFPDRFAKVITAIMVAAAHNADLGRLMALSAFAPETGPAQKRKVLAKIEDHITDGMARGELRDDIDPVLAARMAHGMLEGAMREVMSNSARNPQDAVTHTADAYARWLIRR